MVGKPRPVAVDADAGNGSTWTVTGGVPTQLFGLCVHQVVQVDLVLSQREMLIEARQQEQILDQMSDAVVSTLEKVLPVSCHRSRS